MRPALPVFSLSGATAGFPFGVPLLACPAVLTDFADATSKLAARPRKLLLGSRLPRLEFQTLWLDLCGGIGQLAATI